MMENLIPISAKAPKALMNRRVAGDFEQLRHNVYEKSGHDFLGTLGDVYRDPGFQSKKDGVAYRSNHKTGRAFDYNQDDKNLIIQKAPVGNKMYFRTYLKAAKQDGSLGVKKKIKDIRGHEYEGYVVDFTEEAEKLGFERIPAWNGWQTSYNRQEFWHYQKMKEEGKTLTWDDAMLQLIGKRRPPTLQVYGLNDRGPGVLAIQTRLAEEGLLPNIEIDGIFGPKTFEAVKRFQRLHNLEPDGLVGPNTRKELFKKEN
jgi:hypothetical protein